ncbi:hypothetical protein DC498_24060 [Terrimonas sp.]|uniref:DUF2326 domain-containing protein n=1 Tax=Terrimonas sp. TaxID=1914338 RepID=UPI000D517867|nr:DUF2326 domain-containing protein [Terrimonas sp.]PVD49610.1 hypothetical protein DC498_24060 [Terrimonas sp.]
MKLSQLYANKKFKSIVFNDGLNIVLAKVTKKLDLNKDSHNLGKTTLIAVIDFMLLRNLSEDHIFKKYQELFADYVFYLEILLNSGQYLTIRRSVTSPSKISFKQTNVSVSLLDENEWDYLNLSFAAAEEKLNECLSFDVLQKWGFRKSVTYFLRSQKDYHDVFQLSKFAKGKDVDWKPFMFDMLGFNGDLLISKYNTDTEIAEQKTFISGLKSKFAVDSDEVDKIRGAISLKKAEQADIERQIDNFNFYQQERKLNKELVEDVERRISELNSIEYKLEFDLDKTKESFSQNVSFDINQLKQIYEESKIFFPENLIKDYKDLEDFNKRITAERNKYLEEKIIELTEQLKAIRADLLRYNNKRNEILSVLKDKDSFKKFKGYQIDLTKIEGEISRLDEKLKSIDKIALLNEATEKLTEKLEIIIKDINAEINQNDINKVYPEIRRIFHNIFKYIVNSSAIIFMRQNSQGNVEFKVEVTKENEVDITAEGKGNTYQKLLCISFDIAVLVAYHKQSFYRFVYHDGALEGLDNRKKANYINLVIDYCARYNLQYILTSIEHDIPSEILKTFTPKQICLSLDDSGDEGKLFGFSF